MAGFINDHPCVTTHSCLAPPNHVVVTPVVATTQVNPVLFPNSQIAIVFGLQIILVHIPPFGSIFHFQIITLISKISQLKKLHCKGLTPSGG